MKDQELVYTITQISEKTGLSVRQLERLCGKYALIDLPDIKGRRARRFTAENQTLLQKAAILSRIRNNVGFVVKFLKKKEEKRPSISLELQEAILTIADFDTDEKRILPYLDFENKNSRYEKLEIIARKEGFTTAQASSILDRIYKKMGIAISIIIKLGPTEETEQ